MFYRVKVERKRFTDVFDRLSGEYHWSVECYKDSGENTRQEYDLRGSGFSRTADKAKAKALKHLLGVQKDVDAGLKFGVMFELSGTSEAMKKALESELK